jgi:acyl phosphate:glycerol-3-phosphate acyltransferase
VHKQVIVLRLIIAIAGGYLIGSIPSGYLIGKAYGVDVRSHGSGRTGGTNVWRATKQILPPALTVVGDALKGVAAVLLARHFLGSEMAAALAGATAVIGHNWSVMLGWRGGAGGVTAGGALLALSPLAAAVVLPIALIALYFSHYASVATLCAALGGLLVLLILGFVSGASQPLEHAIFGVITSTAVVMALRPNLKRLAEGTERRITLW